MARLVARRVVVEGGRHRTEADKALGALLLTAACLHAAYLAQDEIYLEDVVALVRMLRAAEPSNVLSANPMAFVRYAGLELEALTPPAAREALDALLLALATCQTC